MEREQCTYSTVADDVVAALRGSCSAAPLRGSLEHYCGRRAVLIALLTELG
eukprot:COSAG01_NODE_48361_length_382_cov_0.625442_1_plen_50_part_01